MFYFLSLLFSFKHYYTLPTVTGDEIIIFVRGLYFTVLVGQDNQQNIGRLW